MAIFRSLKTLIGRNRSCISRRPFFLTSLSISASSQSQSPSPSPPPPPLLLFRTSHFLSRLIVFPFHGPLFLSSPPWKLSQSATPLHFQSDALILPKKFHPFALLRPTTLPFPTKPQHEHRPIAFIDHGLPHSFLNLPNCISIARMVSGPVLGWMIINEWYLPAFAGLAISGATDWLDGFVARKMGINSVVGSYLDPLADKVLIGCVALAMVENNLLHPGLVGLVVLRDTLLVGGAFYNRASSLDWKWKSWSDFVDLDGTRPVKVEPLFISKVNTVFQLILVAAALLQPEFGTAETQAYVNYLSWLVAGTTVASTAGYGVQYMRNRSLLTVRSH